MAVVNSISVFERSIWEGTIDNNEMKYFWIICQTILYLYYKVVDVVNPGREIMFIFRTWFQAVEKVVMKH